ncbi:MAG TPA: prephenate dehydratase [Candidatus Wunengus sp. YC60]|uniref:prephenate dehydratase n=1 Tax=Candidatus Wunengus sp. YC60 TaxID=3367697 RepID=UPI004028381C
MDIDYLRKEIDALDSKIVDLLNERAKIVLKIGEIKKEKQAQIYVPNREQEVYTRIKSQNKGPLTDECLSAIYRELMAGSLVLEKAIKVSYLGPEGTFSYFAAKQKFGSSVEYVPVRGIDDVFRDVAGDRSDYGIVPVENSTEGGIRETLNLFVEYDVKVCAEIILPIHHNLMANCEKEEIEKVYSKPQILSQCKNWLASNLPHAELIEVSSSAEAARIVGDTSKSEKEGQYYAVIANAEIAQMYGLNILSKNIEDNPNNITRFFVLSKEYGAPSGKDRTAIMCYIKNRTGALLEILEPFKTYNINLTNIESLPTRKKAWEYCFYMDFEGHTSNEAIQKALKDVSKKCFDMKILGSFPKCD